MNAGSAQAALQAEREAPPRCLHRRLEPLGSGGNATYRRCRQCGAVLVTYGGGMWAVPAASHPPAHGDENGAEEGRGTSTQRNGR